MAIKVAPAKQNEVIIFEYGARVDKDCMDAVTNQIMKARRLYNDLVASIRDTIMAMNAEVLARAGDHAQELNARIESLTADFTAAKGADDKEGMKRIAKERSQLRMELMAILKEVRKKHKTELQQKYLSRIGKNTSAETYQLRCQAVAGGLGWGTANATLDAAIVAFQKTVPHGRVPHFTKASEKIQDVLTLQFTSAGGIPITTLWEGKHGDLSIQPPKCSGRREYGEFKFRLGSAAEGIYATGTWQYHRPIPIDATVGLARLIRRRIGKDYMWAIQLMVRLKQPLRIPAQNRKRLAAVHFGWASDIEGRRVAGITDSADPGAAHILQLPTEIEEALDRASSIQSDRDAARDEIVEKIKALDPNIWSGLSEDLQAEFKAVRKLPAQHVAQSRLHRLYLLGKKEGYELEALTAWRQADRLRLQDTSHIARRARNARKEFYRREALRIACGYEAVVIEPLNLAEAAKKVDETTGEKTIFSRKGRSGRVIAAPYEIESAIRWACTKTHTAVLELTAEKTAQTCGICGADSIKPDERNGQMIHCDSCGAELDRKKNGAAIAWQSVSDVETLIEEYQTQAMVSAAERAQKLAEKKAKLAEGRRTARLRRGSIAV